ncbi:MAG: methyltransferase [Myxococcota bacterium]|nr:methyltransferase [Myxococcota bacterium]
MKIEEKFSQDAIYCGRLILAQSKTGYRFSIDALILTWFACTGRKAKWTIDLGTGCGVVGLGVRAAGWTQRLVLVERQRTLAALALRNATLNGLNTDCDVLRADIRNLKDLLPAHRFDLIVANPPFWPVSNGHLPENEERFIACFEASQCGIEAWVQAAQSALNHRRGRIATVFPARRLDALMIALDRAHLSGTRLKMVHPRLDLPAELVLVEARAGRSGRLIVEPPLMLKRADNTDTQDALSITEGLFSEALQAMPDRRYPAVHRDS